MWKCSTGKSIETRIYWLDLRIVRKQLDIMPTYRYVQNQGQLMMQSRKNGQKLEFLTISRLNISKLQIFLKNRFHSNLETSKNSKSKIKNPALSLFYIYSPLTSCKKSGKSLEPFLRKLCYQPTNQPTN